MSNSSQAKPQVIVFVGMAVTTLGAGMFFVLLAPASEPSPAAVVTVAVPARAEEPYASPGSHDSEPSPAPVAPVVEREPPAAPVNSKAARMARDLEREQIWAALGQTHGLKPAAPGSAAPSESAASLLPTLDKDYIRATLNEEILPIALECYNTARRENPELSGKVIMNFTIVGSEDIGGIVEESSIDEESTLLSPFVQDCLRESMYAVTFDSPPSDGRVEVSYPLTFEPDDEE